MTIRTGGTLLEADVNLVDDALGLVAFAHGSGSSRKSPRNQQVARALARRGLATLLLDLLTPDESALDAIDAGYRFDIPLLARRLGDATDEMLRHAALRHLPVGYFGASTGAAAALRAAAERPGRVRAIVSRGGRPDLAGDALAAVHAPTLLIVGGADGVVLRLNQIARARMPRAELTVIPGASHLFEEPGALERVERLAADWFLMHLAPAAPASESSDEVGSRTPR